MKELNKMNVEELIEEMDKQYKISQDAMSRAKNCQSIVIDKFLAENHLNNIVIHKRTNIKGVLHKNCNNGFEVDFYPLKKNGEESAKRSFDCKEWYAFDNIYEAFERLKECYEPCDKE